MGEIEDLYQDLILDHSRTPRNFKKLEKYTQSAEGFNPLCGDKVTIYTQCEGDVLKEVSFQGSGCAISKASASILTTVIKNKKLDEIKNLFEKFHHMVTEGSGSQEDFKDLGKLSAFAGVKEFPIRVKCATLPWHTLKAALESKREVISTE